MARPCTVCTHPDALVIDEALMGGETVRYVAQRFGVSKDAIHRHRRNGHVGNALADEVRAGGGGAVGAKPDDLLTNVRHLHSKALQILERAEAAGSLGVALVAIREARSTVELLAKLSGDLDPGGFQIVINSPAWVEIRAAIFTALDRHPTVRAEVVAELRTLEAGSCD